MSAAPYSKAVAARIADPTARRQALGTSADNSAVTLFVFAGPKAWDAVMKCPARLALADDPTRDPALIDWSVVCGRGPVLLVRAGQIDGAHVERLILGLLRDGAASVIDTSSGARYVLKGAR
ncbi:MAG: hypothetical protein M0Z76_10135 [Gammaproteobacteria bacterium]|nr:hypothetical protein [Gammaproteobacteria bacterium]